MSEENHAKTLGFGRKGLDAKGWWLEYFSYDFIHETVNVYCYYGDRVETFKFPPKRAVELGIINTEAIRQILNKAIGGKHE